MVTSSRKKPSAAAAAPAPTKRTPKAKAATKAPAKSPAAKKAAKKPKTGYPTTLGNHTYSKSVAKTQFAAYRTFLTSNPEFGERSLALPFFQSNPQLCAIIGLCTTGMASPDKLAFELNLGGTYRPDFVVACSATKHVLFVELEDGKNSSFFARLGAGKPRLAARLLHAMSQVIDWSFQLSQLSDAGLKTVFGFVPTDIQFLVVCGRGTNIVDPADKLKQEWVTRMLKVESRTVQVLTYDDLEGLLGLHAPAYEFN